jgi:hypothetical protein
MLAVHEAAERRTLPCGQQACHLSTCAGLPFLKEDFAKVAEDNAAFIETETVQVS